MPSVETIYSYSYIPSLILMVGGIVVLLAWVFGTDLYDKIEDFFDDEEFNFILIMHIVCAIISIGIWLWFKDNEFCWGVACVFNTWLAFCITLIFVIFISDILSSVRNYCLTKRGKK